MDGLSQWWKFNENSGSVARNEVGQNEGTLVGMSDSDRLFGYQGKALRFEGDGGHVAVKGYKGILGALPRTTALWVKTTDVNGSLLSWGNDANGERWELQIEGGKLKFNAGGRSLYGKSILSHNQWRHVAVSFPQGSSLLSECILYVDGEVDSNFLVLL